MDSAQHADDEMRTMELIERDRRRLAAQAKATTRALPGERIAGLAFNRVVRKRHAKHALTAVRS